MASLEIFQSVNVWVPSDDFDPLAESEAAARAAKNQRDYEDMVNSADEYFERELEYAELVSKLNDRISLLEDELERRTKWFEGLINCKCPRN